MSKVTASTDFDRVPEEDVPRYVSIFCEQVSNILNRNVSFQDNLNGVLVSCSFGSANTDGNFTHNLQRVPTGYINCGSSVAMIVYTGSVAATTGTITLSSSAIGTALVFVF